ncbi:PilW family protein [Oceanisphaera sp.]|uniref:PilW family protein n=1 Tax=Oceanisphaera sp. TaxID=1929979 RepID=UPI003A919B4B
MKPLVIASRLRQQGLTLLELLGAVAILSLLMAGLGGLIGSALELQSEGQTKNTLAHEAHFAMTRMTESVQNSRHLLLPLVDNPDTSWSEHIRVETVPASPPEGSSTLATAVLAVTLSPRQDLDGDGWADANNDKDFLDLNNNGLRDPGEAELIDEDLDADHTRDGAPGIIGIDDDGDGSVDASSASNQAWDNDEQGGNPGSSSDDDGDGQIGEDSFEPVVYYLSGDQLIERWPSFSDQNGDSLVDGRDYTESVIAEGVTLLRIERVPLGGSRAQLVDITLTLTQDADNSISLQRRVRLGGGL